jgi:hypothetical protein
LIEKIKIKKGVAMMRTTEQISTTAKPVNRDEIIQNLKQGREKLKFEILATILAAFIFFLMGKCIHQMFFALSIISTGASFGQYFFLFKSFNRAIAREEQLAVNSIQTETEE